MFGCSRSGYYAWLQRRSHPDPKKIELKAEDTSIKECMRQICKKLGYVPGKRGFRTYLWRDYDKHVSIKRCRRLMREMGLIAKKPKKDAYKHQASHNHECDCPPNVVNQNFYVGIREIILTDITYLYFGRLRTTFYVCVFKDAYTKEILGSAVSQHMDVNLVRSAYDSMMKQHGDELKKNAKVYIHSDQGSQYLSTTFRRLLSDDGFIQSVSGRGNSQDNAPMESFFSRMKTAILDLVALCPDFETAERLVNGYIDSYNNEQYQYNLAGLTPAEFYIYMVYGIYPCDSYYGVKADEMPLTQLIDARLEFQRKEAEKRRAAYAKKNEERNQLHKTPLEIVTRDQRLILREIRSWENQKELSENKIQHFHEIFEESKKAADFLSRSDDSILKDLMDPQSWKKYPELNYVSMMKEMF